MVISRYINKCGLKFFFALFVYNLVRLPVIMLGVMSLLKMAANQLFKKEGMMADSLYRLYTIRCYTT